MGRRGWQIFPIYVYKKFKNLLPVRNHWADFNLTNMFPWWPSIKIQFKPSWCIHKHGQGYKNLCKSLRAVNLAPLLAAMFFWWAKTAWSNLVEGQQRNIPAKLYWIFYRCIENVLKNHFFHCRRLKHSDKHVNVMFVNMSIADRKIDLNSRTTFSNCFELFVCRGGSAGCWNGSVGTPPLALWLNSLNKFWISYLPLTLILLNNLIIHTHFWLSANQIT